MTLIETGKPNKLITKSAPRNEKGTPRMTQNASDRFKNNARVSMTNTAPCKALFSIN